MTLPEKLEVVYRLIVGKEKHKDIAKRFRVSAVCISSIWRKVIKNPSKMSHDFESRDRKELHQTLIEETVTELVNQNSFIDSCKQVKDKVNEQNEIQVSEEEARKCM